MDEIIYDSIEKADFSGANLEGLHCLDTGERKRLINSWQEENQEHAVLRASEENISGRREWSTGPNAPRDDE